EVAELYIVGDVSVVDCGEVGMTVCPEGLRVADVDPALGRQTSVADRVRALEAADPKAAVEVGGGADPLHQIEAPSNAEHLAAGRRLEDGLFHAGSRGTVRHFEAQHSVGKSG